MFQYDDQDQQQQQYGIAPQPRLMQRMTDTKMLRTKSGQDVPEGQPIASGDVAPPQFPNGLTGAQQAPDLSQPAPQVALAPQEAQQAAPVGKMQYDDAGAYHADTPDNTPAGIAGPQAPPPQGDQLAPFVDPQTGMMQQIPGVQKAPLQIAQPDPNMVQMGAAKMAQSGLGARPTDPNAVTGAHHGWRKAGDVAAGIGIGALTMNPMAGIGTYKMLHDAPLRQAQAGYDAQNARYTSDFENANKMHQAGVADDKVAAQREGYESRLRASEERVSQRDRQLDEITQRDKDKNQLGRDQLDHKIDFDDAHIKVMQDRAKSYKELVQSAAAKRTHDSNLADSKGASAREILNGIELEAPGLRKQIDGLNKQMELSKAAGDKKAYNDQLQQLDAAQEKFEAAKNKVVASKQKPAANKPAATPAPAPAPKPTGAAPSFESFGGASFKGKKLQ